MTKKISSIVCGIWLAGIAGADYARASAFSDGVKSAAEKTGHTDAAISAVSVPVLIGWVLRIVLSFVGVVFLLLLIYAGFIWLMARGNQSEVDKAKNIIQQSIIGLVIVTSAYLIVSYVSTYISF